MCIFSHDSIGLGEDGPTHQPIEQLNGLRAIPNLNVFRPADINETLECWEVVLKSKNNPSAIALSRQKLPYINPNFSEENKSSMGAYVVKYNFSLIIKLHFSLRIRSGISIKCSRLFKKNNIESKVVSVPCQELFDKQTDHYKNDILDKNC